jgi:hypothetical protein
MHPIDEFGPIVAWLVILGVVCLILWDPITNRIRDRIRRWRR